MANKEMKNRWSNFFTSLGVVENTEFFNELKTHYSEQHRKYHNLTHIANSLNELDLVKHLLENKTTIEMAIWYHDVIYNPNKHDNEKQSAAFFRSHIEKMGLNKELKYDTYDLIIATQSHLPIRHLSDSKYLLDIDLSILGKSDLEFLEFENNIRQEYSSYSNDVYKIGRADVLKKFIDRPQIYLTDFFKNKYEGQARINLQKSIDNLLKLS